MNRKDFVQSRRDALLIRAGARSAVDPDLHPDAAALAASGANLLGSLREAEVATAGQPGQPVVAAGFSKGDFGHALADVLREVVIVALRANLHHERLCARLEVPDYRPMRFPSLAIDVSFAQANELNEFTQASLRATEGLSAQLRTFGRDVVISRRALVDDNMDLIGRAFKNVGAAAARLEAELVYALVESNPVLSDGEATFAAGHSNILAAALTESSLSEALGMLRSLVDPFGRRMNLDASVLVVEGRLEALARRFVRDSGLDLAVVASPWLATGRWYVLPDPDVAPILGLLRLEGTKHPVTVAPVPDSRGIDGSVFGARLDTGVVALGRTAIRGGA